MPVLALVRRDLLGAVRSHWAWGVVFGLFLGFILRTSPAAATAWLTFMLPILALIRLELITASDRREGNLESMAAIPWSPMEYAAGTVLSSVATALALSLAPVLVLITCHSPNLVSHLIIGSALAAGIGLQQVLLRFEEAPSSFLRSCLEFSGYTASLAFPVAVAVALAYLPLKVPAVVAGAAVLAASLIPMRCRRVSRDGAASGWANRVDTHASSGARRDGSNGVPSDGPRWCEIAAFHRPIPDWAGPILWRHLLDSGSSLLILLAIMLASMAASHSMRFATAGTPQWSFFWSLAAMSSLCILSVSAESAIKTFDRERWREIAATLLSPTRVLQEHLFASITMGLSALVPVVLLCVLAGDLRSDLDGAALLVLLLSWVHAALMGYLGAALARGARTPLLALTLGALCLGMESLALWPLFLRLNSLWPLCPSIDLLIANVIVMCPAILCLWFASVVTTAECMRDADAGWRLVARQRKLLIAGAGLIITLLGLKYCLETLMPDPPALAESSPEAVTAPPSSLESLIGADDLGYARGLVSNEAVDDPCRPYADRILSSARPVILSALREISAGHASELIRARSLHDLRDCASLMLLDALATRQREASHHVISEICSALILLRAALARCEEGTISEVYSSWDLESHAWRMLAGRIDEASPASLRTSARAMIQQLPAEPSPERVIRLAGCSWGKKHRPVTDFLPLRLVGSHAFVEADYRERVLQQFDRIAREQASHGTPWASDCRRSRARLLILSANPAIPDLRNPFVFPLFALVRVSAGEMTFVPTLIELFAQATASPLPTSAVFVFDRALAADSSRVAAMNKLDPPASVHAGHGDRPRP